jgi:hypothetical protein
MQPTQTTSQLDIEADLLPDQTRLAMVLEAREDIVEAERVLREIEVYRSRAVEGAGELEGG